ncbi:YfhL family 4Fe-4S dicluster ferredoxin [Bdellovibrionota bacterium]
MSYTITEECTCCDACVSECPNDAISEGDDIYTIDAEKCTECVGFFATAQCADVCPVDCCIPNPDHSEDEASLVEKAKKLHPEKDFSGDIPSRFSA